MWGHRLPYPTSVPLVPGDPKGLVLLAVLERGAQDVAERGTRVGRPVSGHGFLLLGDFQRLDGEPDAAGLAVVLGDAGIELKKGETILLYPEGSKPKNAAKGMILVPVGAEIALPVAQDTEVGARILFDDGKIQTRAIKVSPPEIVAVGVGWRIGGEDVQLHEAAHSRVSSSEADAAGLGAAAPCW